MKPVDMSGFVGKLKAEREDFDGLPHESIMQKTEEYIGFLLSQPEAQSAVSSGVALADSAAGLLAGTFSPPGLGAVDTMAATKVMDLLLHAGIGYLQKMGREAIARGGAGQ